MRIGSRRVVMMWDGHDGMGWWMLWGGFLWIIFIVAIVFIASQLAARTGGSNESRASGRPPSAEPPLDIARRWYDAGEISREDFVQIKRDVG